MKMNKKGYGIAATWIGGLITLVVLGIFFIMMNEAYFVYLTPVVDNISLTTNTTILAESQIQNDKVDDFTGIIPIIFFFVIVIGIFITAVVLTGRDDGLQ